MMATLMPMPRRLHNLWHEFHHGVGGGKPLDFSPTLSEVVVWDLVSSLVWMGDAAETAIDKIYAVCCGQTSVTNKINGLRRDNKDGTLNQL